MDKAKQLERQLLAAQKAIESLLNDLRQVNAKEGERKESHRCVWCNKPVFTDESTTRTMHVKCYNEWYKANITSGAYPNVEAAEAAGSIPPKAKPGRKPKDLAAHAEEAKERIQKQLGRKK